LWYVLAHARSFKKPRVESLKLIYVLLQQERWLTDLDRFNEWMNEIDYESDGTHHAGLSASCRPRVLTFFVASSTDKPPEMADTSPSPTKTRGGRARAAPRTRARKTLPMSVARTVAKKRKDMDIDDADQGVSDGQSKQQKKKKSDKGNGKEDEDEDEDEEKEEAEAEVKVNADGDSGKSPSRKKRRTSDKGKKTVGATEEGEGGASKATGENGTKASTAASAAGSVSSAAAPSSLAPHTASSAPSTPLPPTSPAAVLPSTAPHAAGPYASAVPSYGNYSSAGYPTSSYPTSGGMQGNPYAYAAGPSSYRYVCYRRFSPLTSDFTLAQPPLQFCHTDATDVRHGVALWRFEPHHLLVSQLADARWRTTPIHASRCVERLQWAMAHA
jgi:hypothetical protein